ncbi:4Fe-4S dicluster domain-containing protein [Psychromonas sp. PT13]|uniref:4Fe-4S dicluster domain-containing protein n=1 Tax=Psychromonas sp. PT13 TaxID=3439547 RepID=UPI003EBB7754
MAIHEIAGCIGCETCVETCPTDVIQFDQDKQRAYIAYPEDCQICHLCRLYCPVDAITINAEKTIPVMVSWR